MRLAWRSLRAGKSKWAKGVKTERRVGPSDARHTSMRGDVAQDYDADEWSKRSNCAVRKRLAFDRCLRSAEAERNPGSLLRSSHSHPVSSSRMAPALISRCSSVSGTAGPPGWGGHPVLVSRDGCDPWLLSEPVAAGRCLRWPVACCRLDRAPRDAFPYWSAGRMAAPLRKADPRCLKWRWHHRVPGLRPTM